MASGYSNSVPRTFTLAATGPYQMYGKGLSISLNLRTRAHLPHEKDGDKAIIVGKVGEGLASLMLHRGKRYSFAPFLFSNMPKTAILPTFPSDLGTLH